MSCFSILYVNTSLHTVTLFRNNALKMERIKVEQLSHGNCSLTTDKVAIVYDLTLFATYVANIL